MFFKATRFTRENPPIISKKSKITCHDLLTNQHPWLYQAKWPSVWPLSKNIAPKTWREIIKLSNKHTVYVKIIHLNIIFTTAFIKFNLLFIWTLNINTSFKHSKYDLLFNYTSAVYNCLENIRKPKQFKEGNTMFRHIYN